MRLMNLVAACAATLCGLMFGAKPALAQVNLTEGDIAIIGWCDNCAPQDVFTFVTLAPLPSGTIIYFTDNGWTGTQYRNTGGPTDGDGNEQLMKFEATAAIPAGTIISSNSAGSFTWTTTGAIPGAASGTFGFPALAQAGDQLYAFQAPSTSNPLLNASKHLSVLDDTGAFEPATNANNGDIAPGQSLPAGTAATFDQDAAAQAFMGFNTNTLAFGTKGQWLAAIATHSNWTFGAAGTQPAGTINVTQDGGPFEANFIDGSLLFNGSSDGSNTRFDSTLEAGVVLADTASGGGSTGSGLVNALAELDASITSQSGITTVLVSGNVSASLGGDANGFAFISIETKTLQFADDPIVIQLSQPAYFKIEDEGTFSPEFAAITGSIGETQLGAGTYSLSFFMFVTVGSGVPAASNSMNWTLHLSETPFGESLLGDINGDTTVDGADLGLLLGAWNTADPDADLNNDNIVDGADLGLLLGAWST